MKKLCDICHEEFDAVSEDENICSLCCDALVDEKNKEFGEEV